MRMILFLIISQTSLYSLTVGSCNVKEIDTCGYVTNNDFIPFLTVDNSFCAFAQKEVPCLDMKPWKFNCGAFKSKNKFHIELKTFYDTLDFTDSEYLDFSSIPSTIGKYTVLNSDLKLYNTMILYSTYSRVNEDVGLASWEIDESLCNFIEIISIDEINQIIIGKFEVHFKDKYPDFGIQHSFRINFLNGTFTAYYIQ